MFRYQINLYWSEEDQSYLAEVPELPGCMADGQSYQLALDNVQVIMQEWIETAQELGREIPVTHRRLSIA
jgi:predicted RNase H-like HicB family nuclease